jgi:hypothetical protein
MRALIAALIVLTAARPDAAAQQSASSGIIGQVVDSTHAGVPGATVTATNIGTGAERAVVTDAEGRFSIPALPAATYRLRVELGGFRTSEITNLVLRSGETVRSDVTLALSTLAETITVQGESPLLSGASATVGATISEKMLEELPLSDRTLLNVTALAPGVTPRDFQRQNLFYGRRDQYVTVEGGRDSSTNYVIDGVYVRTLRWNNMSLNPPIDTVQEVNLLRNAFSTEYGQGQAVVSMVTKSGTNRHSFSTYEYFRDDALEAKNYFAVSKTPHERNQFGGTYGGPLAHNKLFLFTGYEGLRQTKGEVQFANLPNPAWLTGDFSSVSTAILDPMTAQPFSGNRIPQSRITPFAALQLSAVPTPNTTGANNYRVVRNFTDDTNTLAARVDHALSTNHTSFGRYIWYDSQQSIPNAITDTGQPQTGRNLAVGHTWVLSPNTVNETRFGYNFSFHGQNSRLAGEDYLARNWVADVGLHNLYGSANSDYYGRPGATIAGFGGIVPATGASANATDWIYSVSNATSKVAGAHTLRFGFQAEWRKTDQDTTTGARGGFTFNGRATGAANNAANAVADFLLGYCSTCTGTFGGARSTYKSPTFAPFLDDVWRVSNALTLQLGVRWEYLAPWHEVNDIEGSFDPAAGKIAYHKVPADLPASLLPLVIAQDNYFPAGIVKKDLNNFGPRLGMVYQLNSRTLLRSGFGLYFDNLNLNELQFTRLVPPFSGRYDASPTGTQLVNVADLYPDPRLAATFPTPFSMNPANVSAYVRQWNVNVQRTFGRQYVLEVAYTGSQSRHEHKRFNLNQPREGTAPQAERLPYPQFAPALLTSSDTGHGDFKGVSVRLDKQFADGLFFTGSYQLSKNQDNNSGEIEANDTAFAWDHEADWARSRYDRPHRSSISFGYDLPWGAGKRWLSNSGAMSRILGDWQLSGAVRMQSGVPFSVSVSALQNLGSFVPQRGNFAPGREGDKGELADLTEMTYLGATALRWFDPAAYAVPPAGFQGRAGRNTLRGPSYRRLDAALAKRFPFNTASRIEFRAEIFNLLNTTNFGTPAGNISNSNAGVITSADDARNAQLSLRVVW